MSRYIVKLSDSSGYSANVTYSREEHLHKVEYYKDKQYLGMEFFNTQIEATQSASKFLDGVLNGKHFNFF